MTTSTATAIAGRSRIDTSSFTPMHIGGEEHGEVHFVRDDTAHGRVNRVAVWRLSADQVPYDEPYEFRSDETFLVLEGELEMTLQDGSVHHFFTGDIVSVVAGTQSRWRILQPFKKYVVETGA